MTDKNIVGEFNIDSVSIATLLRIVSLHEDDPWLIEGYILTDQQLEEINIEPVEKIVPDYKSYYYVLECTGIYDYDLH